LSGLVRPRPVRSILVNSSFGTLFALIVFTSIVNRAIDTLSVYLVFALLLPFAYT
jgi:hypothetical protein